jgi:hypothetical protein
VLADKPGIEQPHLRGRYRPVLSHTDAGGEAVDIVSTRSDVLGEGSIDTHTFERITIERHRAGRARSRYEVWQREVMTGQREHGVSVGETARVTIRTVRDATARHATALTTARLVRSTLPSNPAALALC